MLCLLQEYSSDPQLLGLQFEVNEVCICSRQVSYCLLQLHHLTKASSIRTAVGCLEALMTVSAAWLSESV